MKGTIFDPADAQFALNLLNAFADNVIASRGPNEIIERHASPYIERWMLSRKSVVPTFVASRSRIPVVGAPVDDPTLIPTEIEYQYLHRYCRSDPEDLHCHPWGNVTLVLRGELVEVTPAGSFRRVAGDYVVRAPEERHAIGEVQPGTVTLFATGPKVRDWGFYPEGTFVHHRDYRAWREERGLADQA